MTSSCRRQEYPTENTREHGMCSVKIAMLLPAHKQARATGALILRVFLRHVGRGNHDQIEVKQVKR